MFRHFVRGSNKKTLKFAAALALLVQLMAPHSTLALFGDDYPWKAAQPTGAQYSWRMPGDNDIYSPLGFAYRNCTDYAAWRLNVARGGNTSAIRFSWSSLAFPGGNGNASGWKQGAINSGYRVDSSPSLGSIAWWGGGYGHIAVVGEVSSSSNIVLEDYNYAGTGSYSARRVTSGSGWPQAFLHIADTTPPQGSYPRLNGQFVGSDRLGANQILRAGQYILSHDARFALVMQADGNLVLYSSGMQAKWSSNTGGSGATHTIMQADGNLVLYRPNGTPAWASATSSRGSSTLVVQPDGNLVIYPSSGGVSWQTRTGGQPQMVYAGGERLWNNQSLYRNQYIRSADGRYVAAMQADGNLVVMARLIMCFGIPAPAAVAHK